MKKNELTCIKFQIIILVSFYEGDEATYRWPFLQQNDDKKVFFFFFQLDKNNTFEVFNLSTRFDSIGFSRNVEFFTAYIANTQQTNVLQGTHYQ